MVYLRADKLGAAAQRNQGVAAASHDFILFHDDDIIFEPHCIARLWAALNSSSLWGGINAMISNQQYSTPGRVTGPVLRILGGAPGADYAGRVIGPGVNLLPADRPTMPDVVPVDWLSTTCTLYRREALPVPPFLAHFTGYSLMEDLALSLMVGKSWKLANARTARIFHDSQPGDHKNNHAQLAEMELVNRHFVMTKVLGLSRPSDYLRLGMWEAFVLAATVPFGFHRLAAETWGKTKGLLSLLRRAAG
jgi:glycosyltransferase involved in cell wall biosynthesis